VRWQPAPPPPVGMSGGVVEHVRSYHSSGVSTAHSCVPVTPRNVWDSPRDSFYGDFVSTPRELVNFGSPGPSPSESFSNFAGTAGPETFPVFPLSPS
jgi:hypothetical protein